MSDKLKDIVKHGWHPEKDVNLSGGLKGLMGKGDKKEKEYRTPIPIASLRDPASFPPPPRHIATGATPSPPPGQPYRPPPAGASHQSYTTAHPPHEQPLEEPPAPKPYRVDTTGLSTSHLPPPPVRRPGGITSTPSPPPTSHARPAPPSLPPRLPPRTATPTTTPQPPPPARTAQPAPQQSYINQSALSSLSSKGISVPGFNVGSTFQTSGTPTHPAPTSSTPAATGGTSWAQKRAALQTASSGYKDPSSVSMSDASAAASTFNNFRQRHGDQVASGVAGAGAVAGRVNAFTSGDRTATPSQHPTHITPSTTPSIAASVVGKKKPPPPPPGKKPVLAPARTGGASHGGDAPPPVPLATRPQF